MSSLKNLRAVRWNALRESALSAMREKSVNKNNLILLFHTPFSVLCGRAVRVPMTMKTKILLTTILLFASAFVAKANVTLPDVLSDSMVLQREHVVPIWGRADAGESITVRFAGQTKTTVADKDGKWHVNLSALKANATPATMTIEGKNKIELKDILVGEVWLVSGQSNMQWRLIESNNGEAEVAAAKHPLIRLFNVSRQVAFKHAQPPLAVWQACSPQSVKEFSGAGYYFGVELQKELNVPIGLINSSYGGSQAEAWTPVEYLNAKEELRPTVERTKIWEAERPKVKADYDAAIQKWKEESEKAKTAGARPSPSPSVPDALREYRIASSIYDGMIEPLIPFYIRGAIWYQGESNEARAEQYKLLLPTMIRAWRERWGEGDFPFGIIQLPNYRAQKDEPTDEAWSHIREAQRLTSLNTPNTGLIVTIDIGVANDIHPKNKLDVGKRMARWALVDVYKWKMTKSGPVFRNAKTEGSKIVLTFDEAGSGLKIRDGDKLDEFAIAGADGKWRWANAKIVGKDKVEVWSDEIKQPAAVRYAFNNNPKHPNLTNDSGLPASPFRTDNFADPTKDKR